MSSDNEADFSMLAVKKWQEGFYVLLALIPWFLILISTGRGYDLTDESFYLLNYTQPENITANFSMFGVVIRPLFDLAGGNIALTRFLGVIFYLVTLILATWVTARFFAVRRGLSPNAFLKSRQTRLLFLLPISGGALYYQSWLITPSYNWSTLVGLTLFWTGFLLWLDQNQPRTMACIGSALIGFAAAFIFWSKATSAVFLVFYPLGGLILNLNQWKRLLALPTLASGILGLALGLSIPLLYGFTPESIYNILAQGIERTEILLAESSSTLSMFSDGIRRFSEFIILNVYPLVALPLWIMPFVFTIIVTSRSHFRMRDQQRLRFLLFVSFVANLILITFLLTSQIGYWMLNIWFMTAIFLALSQFIGRKLSPEQHIRWLPEALWSLPVFFTIFVFIFGTTNNYAGQTDMAGYFFMLSLFVLFITLPDTALLKNKFITFTMPVVLGGVIFIMLEGSLNPYRQDMSVWEMHEPVSFHNGEQTLLVSLSMANYVTDLQQTAAQAGFEAGTPLIDLTGHSPGAIYALEGDTYVFPWLLGGYEGSDPAAVYALTLWDRAKLETAWLLTAEENGERNLSLTVLDVVGLNFPEEYRRVGTVQYPGTEEVQTLWQPVE